MALDGKQWPVGARPAHAWRAVGKITGKEGLVFEGRALCFNCEEDMLAALERDQEQFKVVPHVWFRELAAASLSARCPTAGGCGCYPI